MDTKFKGFKIHIYQEKEDKILNLSCLMFQA